MADNNNSKSIDELQQEIDAVLKEREKRRRELQQEVLTFQDEFKSVKTNIQAADIRLKNETKAFQEKMEKQKALLESVDASILEKMQQLEKLKEANEKGSSFPAANALVPLVALGVTAVVVIRQRSLEEEIDRIQKEAEAEVRRDLAKAKQQPQGPIALLITGVLLSAAIMFSGLDIDNANYEAITRGQGGEEVGQVERKRPSTEQLDSQRKKTLEALANSVSNVASGIGRAFVQGIKSLNESGVTESVSNAASSVARSAIRAIDNLPQPKEIPSESNKDKVLIEKAKHAVIQSEKENLKQVLEEMQKQVDSIPTTTEIEKQFKAQVEAPATKPPAVENSNEKEVKPPSKDSKTTNTVEESRASPSTEKPSKATSSKSDEQAEIPSPKTNQQPVTSAETTNKEESRPSLSTEKPSKATSSKSNEQADIPSQTNHQPVTSAETTNKEESRPSLSTETSSKAISTEPNEQAEAAPPKTNDQPLTSTETTNKEESRASLSTETPSKATSTKSEEPAETAPPKTTEQPITSPEKTNKEKKQAVDIPVDPSSKAPAAVANVEASADSSVKKDDTSSTPQSSEAVPTLATEQSKKVAADNKQQAHQPAPDKAPPSPPTSSPQSSQEAKEDPLFKPPTDYISPDDKEKTTKAEVDTKSQEEVSTKSTSSVESSKTQVVAKKYESLVEKADEALGRAKRDEASTPVSDWNWDSQCIERIGSNGPCIQSF
jgi:predicted regulator of Ras-like GTPase activity (Roadblock/LC7/MglB family)